MTPGPKTSIHIILTADEKKELQSMQRSSSLPAGLVRRGRIILLLASGQSVQATARSVSTNKKRVYKWAQRFLENRIDGLADKPGRGRKPSFSPYGSCTRGEACL